MIAVAKLTHKNLYEFDLRQLTEPTPAEAATLSGSPVKNNLQMMCAEILVRHQCLHTRPRDERPDGAKPYRTVFEAAFAMLLRAQLPIIF